MQPSIVVVGRIREAPEISLKHVDFCDLPHAVVENGLICLGSHDQSLQVHQLIDQNEAEFFQTCRTQHHLEGVWI